MLPTEDMLRSTVGKLVGVVVYMTGMRAEIPSHKAAAAPLLVVHTAQALH